MNDQFPTGDAAPADPSDSGFARDPRAAAADAAGGPGMHPASVPSPGEGEAAPSEQSAASLLSDEEFAALRHDPVALRNAYERAARASQDPRERALIDGLRENPQATIRAIAQHLGMTVSEAQEAIEQAQEGQTSPAPSPLANLQLPDDLAKEFNEVLGDTDLASRLTPAIAKLVDHVVRSTFGKDLSAIQTDLQTRQNEAAVRSVEAAQEAFFTKNPEARAARAELDKLAEMIQPADSMGLEEYLDMLYGVYLHRSGRASTVAAERLQRGAQAAATSPRKAGASPSMMRVPIGKVSFEKAAELAKQGIKVSG